MVVDFFADWCGPCKRILPDLTKWAAEHKDVAFIKVNVDDLPAVQKMCDVEALPTFHFYYSGRLIEQHVGGDFTGFLAAFRKAKSVVTSSTKP